MMRKTLSLLVPTFALGVAIADVHDAAACGGCFVPPEANTQVTGHRMVLSVSPTETTLWDQIAYDGDPASFAWVLPIKGQVDIGLSSDLLFNTLALITDTVIVPPSLSCPNSCPYEGAGGAGVGSGGGGGSGNGVTVIAQEVVGPYETVQLAATDPAALQAWLDTNGYQVPDDVAPIIDEYLAEGFGFLALKLVPGQGIDSMKPVRITSPGGSPQLPLRMVAAGTGAITPITLWVVGEGRYEPSNFGSFTIPADDVVWNWDTSESNYAVLEEERLAANGGDDWLVEHAAATSPFSIEQYVTFTIDNEPDQSGYGEGDWESATAAAQEDLAALYGAVDRASMWLTRLHARLPRAALSTDLQLAAASDQSPVSSVLYVQNTTGTGPVCPPDPCGSASATSASAGGGWLPGGEDDGMFPPSNGSSVGESGSCGLARGDLSGLGVVGMVAALAAMRRRRRRTNP